MAEDTAVEAAEVAAIISRGMGIARLVLAHARVNQIGRASCRERV